MSSDKTLTFTTPTLVGLLVRRVTCVCYLCISCIDKNCTSVAQTPKRSLLLTNIRDTVDTKLVASLIDRNKFSQRNKILEQKEIFK